MTTTINLNQYIGHSIHCNCGKTHQTNLRCIDIDKDAVKRLPEHIKELGYENVFMVADVNTYEAAGKLTEESLKNAGINYGKFIFPDRELVPDEHAVGRVMQAIPKNVDLILAVGSGTLNDLCKFVSFQLGIEYMICASAPSMDGFVSVGAALITDHVKTTYNAHVPIAVIGDTEILAQAPMEMITAGLGDILGKYTCLVDWKMAHLIEGEYYCEDIAQMVKEAVKICVEQSSRMKQRDPDAVKSVMEALVLTGIAMSFVGNSRPASGSEHHLSHYWEMQFQMQGKKPVLHGVKVGIGMIAVLNMYHKLAQLNPDFEQLKKNTSDYAAWEKKVKECYKDAADGIIRLEEQCKKNSIELRNYRLDIMEEKWDEIKEIIATEIPDVSQLEQLMDDLGSPINPEQVGISSELVEDAIILAKEVRNRYTILQMLWDMNLLEDYAKDVAAYFAEGQKTYFSSLNRQYQGKMDKIKLFVLDMDGTIYLENQLFPFTKHFLEEVEASGRSYCYFTNNSSKNQKDYLNKLNHLGIPVEPKQMFLSTQVILEYMKEKHPEASYYIVGTPSLVKAFEEDGLTVTEEDPDIVILGFDTTLTYEKISKACQYIRDGAGYYGVNPDYNCPMKGGTYIPDCGSIAKLVEQSTGRFPEFFGKPSHHTFDYIMEQTGYHEDEIAVVGDRIYTDVALAADSRATSIMVLTGESTKNDMDVYGIIPDMVVNSLESLIPYL